MKRIIKNQPTQSLKVWFDKQHGLNCRYDNLDTTLKDEIKADLLGEQGFLCCYTGKRVGMETSHIEHLKPQTISRRNDDDHDDVSYQNMLAAYPKSGSEIGRAKCVFGAERRGSWFDEQLFVTPLQENCEQRFSFDLNGKISPANKTDDAAAKTIKMLNLDDEILIAERRAAIESLLFADELSLAQVQRLGERIMEKDGKGRFRTFCFALRQACALYAERKEKQQQRNKFIQQAKKRK